MTSIDNKVWDRNNVIKIIGLIASLIGIFGFITGIFSIREVKNLYESKTSAQKKVLIPSIDTLSAPDQATNHSAGKPLTSDSKEGTIGISNRDDKQLDTEPNHNYPLHVNEGDSFAAELHISNIMRELSKITASEILMKTLDNHRNNGILLLGEKKQDFLTDRNLYVFFFDDTNVMGAFKFQNGRYFSLVTDDILSSTRSISAGTVEIWVQDHSEN